MQLFSSTQIFPATNVWCLNETSAEKLWQEYNIDYNDLFGDEQFVTSALW
jgi:hypothetical protein